AKGDGYWATQVEIQRLEATSWIAFVEGKHHEALQLGRAATELEAKTDKLNVTPGSLKPAQELLADMLMELKRPAEALAEYEGTLKVTPRRLASVRGAKAAAELAGDQEKAKNYSAQLAAVKGD